MSLALSTCVLFISLMQLIKEAQFLNATPLSLSSTMLHQPCSSNCYCSLNKDACINHIN